MTRTQLVESLLKKVASGTVTPEEGALLLNDLARRAGGKEELCDELLALYRRLPRDRYAPIFLQITALTDNPSFERVLIEGLEHPDEQVGQALIDGMARYGHDAAKTALTKQVAHPLPRIRKAAATKLVERAGDEGVRIVIATGLCGDRQEMIDTAYTVLSGYGGVVIPLLIDAMAQMSAASLTAAAKLLLDLRDSLDIEDSIDQERVGKLVQVVQKAVAYNQPNLVISVLEILHALKGKLAGHEDIIAGFLQAEHVTIKLVAHKVLSGIDTERARGLLSAGKISIGGGGYLIEQ